MSVTWPYGLEWACVCVCVCGGGEGGKRGHDSMKKSLLHRLNLHEAGTAIFALMVDSTKSHEKAD